jgi:hypothetical protein
MYSGYKEEYDAKKAQMYAQDKLKKEKEAQEKRDRELEQAKDKEKWEAVVKHLKETPPVEMRSGQYRAKMKIVTDFIDSLK